MVKAEVEAKVEAEVGVGAHDKLRHRQAASLVVVLLLRLRLLSPAGRPSMTKRKRSPAAAPKPLSSWAGSTDIARKGVV